MLLIQLVKCGLFMGKLGQQCKHKKLAWLHSSSCAGHIREYLTYSQIYKCNTLIKATTNVTVLPYQGGCFHTSSLARTTLMASFPAKSTNILYMLIAHQTIYLNNQFVHIEQCKHKELACLVTLIQLGRSFREYLTSSQIYKDKNLTR